MFAHNYQHTNKRGAEVKPRLATINITKEQRDWLADEAKRTGRTRAEVVRTLIQKEVEKDKLIIGLGL